jgi:hypothetical protein
MFELTLLDHLRLTFGHVVYRHKAHTHLAWSRARWSRWLKAAEALLMIVVLVTALAAAFGNGRGYMVFSAVLAALALVPLVVQLAIDLDGSARVHHACASALWPMRERYRAVMSDLRDGAIDIETARRQRDLLIEQLHAIYENAPPAEAHAYQKAAEAIAVANEPPLTDEEIDLFLPKSLQKAGKSATA